MSKYKEDLQYIRQMMEKSSTFISLSGWSGISAGIIGLCSSAICWFLMDSYGIDYFDGNRNIYPKQLLINIFILALLTIIFTLGISYYFTHKKARKLNLPIWTGMTKYLIIQLCIPLISGGIISLIFIWYKLYFLAAPTCLVFYGLSLTSASKYLKTDLFWLGICEIILGLLGMIIPGYGLVLWSIGFGLLHIVYGIVLQNKYP
ncbi:MAG: hypothetical protein ABIO44_02455 [Saprospiraceae bacterium]